jgi:hypothetical protein
VCLALSDINAAEISSMLRLLDVMPYIVRPSVMRNKPAAPLEIRYVDKDLLFIFTTYFTTDGSERDIRSIPFVVDVPAYFCRRCLNLTERA